MLRRLLCLLWLGAALGAPAQSGKIITVRIVDGKTGKSITPDNLRARFKAGGIVNADWVKPNDDGSMNIRVPEGATSVSLRATYENSTAYYVNCDVSRQKDTTSESWYPIADILSGGIKSPDECVKDKDADKIKVDVNPGEFILFVRKKNWREGGQD